MVTLKVRPSNKQRGSCKIPEIPLTWMSAPKHFKHPCMAGNRSADFLEVLKMVFNFVLGPPSPGGVPGEGPDCHFPTEIVGFGLRKGALEHKRDQLNIKISDHHGNTC